MKLANSAQAAFVRSRYAWRQRLRLVVFACSIALFFRTNFAAVMWTGGIASFFYSMPAAMAAAALQVVTPVRMRGLATSIYIVMVTLMGLSVTPLLVAFFTDKVFHDEARFGDALAIVCASATAPSAFLPGCVTRRLSAASQHTNRPFLSP